MANDVKPLTPNEALRKRGGAIPSAVYEIFNELIVANMVGQSSTVWQDDVVDALVKRGFHRDDVFARHWLDIEDEYRRVGWRVTYDKPGYNETYRANYVFTKGRDDPRGS
jgi:hypothetical protein